ncbi:MAG: class I SAM-dependent methyltransferase [Egibacteraceae bacterium]
MGQAKDAWADVCSGALPTPPADVLDVGTGTGQVALLLADLGHRVTGIDLAEGMLALARAKSASMANPRPSRSPTPSRRPSQQPASTS